MQALHSEAAVAVAFESKPGLAILLINAVLSTPGKCACIPLVRSVLLSPTTHTVGREGAKKKGGRGLLPAAVPLFPTPDQGPRCAHRQQQQFEQCKSPVGPRHLQMHPHYVTQWRNYRANKSTSGRKNSILTNQTNRQEEHKNTRPQLFAHI